MYAARRTLGQAAVCAALLYSAGAMADSPPGKDASQAVRDAWIDGRLETTYALNPYLNPLRIDTEVEDGVVTLSGTLSSDIDRDLAVEIARGIDGVRNVNDQLDVDASARPSDSGASGHTFAQRVDDAIATARVKTSLIANGSTKGLSIDVDTEDNVVTLKGSVSSNREKMLAEMIARNTEGVTGVHNELRIDERS